MPFHPKQDSYVVFTFMSITLFAISLCFFIYASATTHFDAHPCDFEITEPSGLCTTAATVIKETETVVLHGCFLGHCSFNCSTDVTALCRDVVDSAECQDARDFSMQLTDSADYIELRETLSIIGLKKCSLPTDNDDADLDDPETNQFVCFGRKSRGTQVWFWVSLSFVCVFALSTVVGLTCWRYGD